VLTSLPHLPRALLAIAAALSLVAVLTVPADARQGPPAHAAAARHEVWMLDQGTDLVHVLDSHRYQETATIDLSPEALQRAGFAHAPTGAATVPHMIDFDPQERFAFIAATAGGATIVVDTHTKRVVEVLPTGPGSHMAAVTPDGTTAWVSVIGPTGDGADLKDTTGRQLVEITFDPSARRPAFEIGTVLPIGELLGDEATTYPSLAPVCHQYSPDGREAWITLGPGSSQGGLIVLDLESHELTQAFDPDVVQANCGLSLTDDLAVANWSGEVVAGADTNGETYVFDRRGDEPTLVATIRARGTDTHGLRLTPDGETYWQVNRNSGDVELLATADLLALADLPEAERPSLRTTATGLVLDAPDILDFSPDGATVYVTQRGPSPRSGAVHSATGSDAGVVVIDAASEAVLTTLRPPTVREEGSDRILNDVHGVGVRTTTPGERGQAQAERAQRPAVVPARADRDAAGFHCGLPSA
jgi:DNA-binding beta-propeller fold protein YncE